MGRLEAVRGNQFSVIEMSTLLITFGQTISSKRKSIVGNCNVNFTLYFKGGGGVQAYQFGKKDFELGVGGEGQDTSRNFEGSFGSIHAILPM